MLYIHTFMQIKSANTSDFSLSSSSCTAYQSLRKVFRPCWLRTILLPYLCRKNTVTNMTALRHSPILRRQIFKTLRVCVCVCMLLCLFILFRSLTSSGKQGQDDHTEHIAWKQCGPLIHWVGRPVRFTSVCRSFANKQKYDVLKPTHLTRWL